MLTAALFGFLSGWIVSVPIAGPISALVVARAVEGRFRAGRYIALGGGLVEALYAFLAFFGFSTFLAEFPIIEPISQAGGTVVLVVLGVVFLRKDLSGGDAPAQKVRDTARGSFALGVWICAINPTLIASWSAFVSMVHSSGAIDIRDNTMAFPFAVGCAFGITGWFMTLLWLIRRYRERFTPSTLNRVVRIIGVVLLLLAVWLGWRFVSYFFGPTSV